MTPRSLAAAVALATILATGPSRADGEPLTVVELFTSQGCSSCPPADAFLGELTGRADVLPLSLHVDYWDYIGWKDPFASPRFTQRQREYQPRFGLTYVYTPQMVIHGASQAVGSNRKDVFSRIAAARSLPRVPVSIRAEADDVVVTVATADAATAEDEAAILVVTFDPRHETRIARGENGGRALRNYNVVRSLVEVGTWRGRATEVRAPRPPAGTGCAAIVQSVRTGHILGAARLASK